MKKIVIIILNLIFFISVSSPAINADETTKEKVMNYSENTIIDGVDPTLEQSAPLIGYESFTNLVIFIRYADEANYSAPYGSSYYENLFNDLGPDAASVRDYYREASYEQLDIYSKLFYDDQNKIIYYTDINERSYYEPYSDSNPNGYSDSNRAVREHRMLGRAVNFIDENNLVEDSIDLDVNQDGDIDSLTFMISGEDNGWSSLFWPHKWAMYTDYGTNDAPSINGKFAYTFTFNLLGFSRDYSVQTSVGILAHETFHLLGAPDLYSYNNFSYMDFAGPWSLMDANQTILPHMLGYMKYKYGGWIDEVTTITTSGNYTLYPSMDSPENLMRFDTGYSNEYLYMEYRVKEGVYESTLPGEGLLLYRVDEDYVGNESGYSATDYGEGICEVFVFRPNIGVTEEPIGFPLETNTSSIAGNLYLAALSNNNTYDSANTDDSFLLFHSDGSLMNITIENVTEIGGYINFDVKITANLQGLKLQIDGEDIDNNTYFFDDPRLTYESTLINGDGYDIYVSLDNDPADLNDEIYDGQIFFNNEVESVHLLVMQDGLELGRKEIKLKYVNDIETNHNPYGNMVTMKWIIPKMTNLLNVEVMFGEFETEEGYDYFYIQYNGGLERYDDRDLNNQTLKLENLNTSIIFQFISDEYLDDYFGVLATLNFDFVLDLSPEEAVSLNGPTEISLRYGESYYDEGLIYELGYENLYTIEVEQNLDTLVSGSYNYSYLIYLNDVLVHTITRIIVVREKVELGFDYIEDFELELNDQIEMFDIEEYIFNPRFNGDNYTISLEGELKLEVGQYELTVKIEDNLGDSSEQTFTITVIDTTNPIVVLEAGLDTIFIGQDHSDNGVQVFDYSETNITVYSTVDSSQMGSYSITYIVEDAEGNLSEIIRYVNVISSNKMVFEIESGITTYNVGQKVKMPECNAFFDNELFECEVDSSNLDNLVSGDYKIRYHISHNGVGYEKIIYVFILPEQPDQSSELYLPRKEGEWI